MGRTGVGCAWAGAVAIVAILVGVGVGVWTAISRMSDEVFWLFAGSTFMVLTMVVLVSLFVIRDAVNAYTINRLSGQDNFTELKQMAMLKQLMGSSRNSTTVKMPDKSKEAQNLFAMFGRPQQSGGLIEGDYVDALDGPDIEIE